ncbi:MAG TPA: serine hydrolase [Gemmatimonadaceae bacterium]|jgi:CubicO group peptidase (beta-lactamase class C family)
MHLVRTSLLFALSTLLVACDRTAFHENGGEVVNSPTTTTASDAAIRDSVKHVMDRALHDSAFPGAIAVVGRRSGIIEQYPVGRLDWAAGSAMVDAHTMYDMASLTKVVGMTSGLMQLVAAGRIDLDAPVQKYLPAWTGRNKERVLVRNLSTHTSGLPADRNYDQITHDPDSVAKLMFSTPLDTVPNARMLYSDIGAYLLGRIVEQVTGQSLDLYLHDHVFEPTGMHESMFRPPVALYPRIAPTEYDSAQRRRLIRGMVHDERAYYLGGVSAHAGLFSSGNDVARFVRMMMNGGVLDGAQVIPAATIVQFTKRQTADRALGWQKPDGKNSAGHRMPEEAYGHTGFTGTSIWIDPKDDVFVVLLSNRVDPTRNNNKIGRYRVQLADAVMSVILSDRSSR